MPISFTGLQEFPEIVEGEFWTSRQRQASSLHEISYRACFKPQLPRFFIERYSLPGDTVYDPFMGRGTTIIEAAMMGRAVVGNDINPLSTILTQPRLEIPTLDAIKTRINELHALKKKEVKLLYSMFFHEETEREIHALRGYLKERATNGTEDSVDRWIRMVATNRLTGHSKGFFSVYTLPPNQATTPEQQVAINRRLRQKPEYRNVFEIIWKKTISLLRDVTKDETSRLQLASKSAMFLQRDASSTPQIASDSIQLTVTSPPFLNIVNYRQDNWLRCWFNGIDIEEIARKISSVSSITRWEEIMGAVFRELFRITRSGGWVAFEVGEIRKGSVKLDELVVPLGTSAGFHCRSIVINKQEFTKTSNIWGIKNNSMGTNTNRIVLFQKQ